MLPSMSSHSEKKGPCVGVQQESRLITSSVPSEPFVLCFGVGDLRKQLCWSPKRRIMSCRPILGSSV